LVSELLAYWDETFVARGAVFVTRAGLALLAALMVWLAGRVVARASQRALERARAHVNARLLIDRLIQFAVLVVAGAWVLSIFGVQLTALVAVLGAAALAVSLALQDVLKNLVAGLYMLVERPFALGDLIEFKTYSGVVENIQLRTTALRTADGRRVVVPNAMLFTDTLVNLSVYGRRAVRLRITLPSADADSKTAAEVLRAAQAALPASDEVAVHLEEMTGEKVALRLESWAPDARRAASELAWALRDALPKAEIKVLE